MKPTSVPSYPRWWITMAVIVVLTGSFWFALTVNHTRNASPPIERQRSELVFKGERFFERDGVTPFSGVVLETYDGGELKSRSPVVNGSLHGLSQGWWTNGVLQVSESYSNGISQGVRTKYYPDGHKLSEAWIVAGKLEGSFQRWHENGALAEKIQITDGIPDGESFAYHSDGSLKAHVQLDRGRVITQSFFAPGEAQ